MASETRLNQIVKGVPTVDLTPPTASPLQSLGKASQSEKYSPDPHLAILPSSPPQIYLNLLILESSLRAQYLHLVSRRRLNSFFLLVLAAWNIGFFYALFIKEREDGTGRGGSVYWVIETSEKLALMGGAITVLLVWGTGQWERAIRWPRKWLGTTNRGLRPFNLRVVVTRGKLWRETLGHLSFLLPLGMWREAGGSDWHLVEHENGSIVEEDLARGGDHIMLLLLPKSFSPEFRENWEGYRTEYWDKENERRRGLHRKMEIQRRVKAKETGGWKWWTGMWRLTSRSHHRRHQDLEKHPHGHQHHQSSSRHVSISEHSRPSSVILKGRRNGMRSDSTHSRQSSRSSTPHLENGGLDRPLAERVRRGSSVSSTASVRRKTREHDGKRDSLIGGSGLSPLTSASSVLSAEDERLERRRRRKEREAAKEAKDREKEKDLDRSDAGDGESRPTTPKTESMVIKSEPA